MQVPLQCSCLGNSKILVKVCSLFWLTAEFASTFNFAFKRLFFSKFIPQDLIKLSNSGHVPVAVVALDRFVLVATVK